MSSFPGTISLTYQAQGLEKLQSSYDEFLRYVASHQPNVNFGGGGAGGGGGGALTFAGGSGGGGGGGGPSYGGNAAYTANVLNATQNISSSVSNQVRNLMTSIDNSVRNAVTQQFSSYQSSIDNSVTNVYRGGSGSGGGGGGYGLAGLGPFGRLLGPIAAVHGSINAYQNSEAMRDADLHAGLSSTMAEYYKAQQEKTRANFSGFFGSVAGIGYDVAESLGSGTPGPSSYGRQLEVASAQSQFNNQARGSYLASANQGLQRSAYNSAIGGGQGTDAAGVAMQRAGIYGAGTARQAELSAQIAEQRQILGQQLTGTGAMSPEEVSAIALSRQKIQQATDERRAVGEDMKFKLQLLNTSVGQSLQREHITSSAETSALGYEANRDPLSAAYARINGSYSASSIGKSPAEIADAYAKGKAAAGAAHASYAFAANTSILGNQGEAAVNALYTGGQPYFAHVRAIENARDAELRSVTKGPLADQERSRINSRFDSEESRFRYDWKNESISGLASLGVHNSALTALAQSNDPLRDLKAQALSTGGNTLIKAFQASIGEHPEFTHGLLQSGILGLQAERQDYKDRFRAEEADPTRIATGPGAGENPVDVFKSIDDQIKALLEADKAGLDGIKSAIEKLGTTK